MNENCKNLQIASKSFTDGSLLPKYVSADMGSSTIIIRYLVFRLLKTRVPLFRQYYIYICMYNYCYLIAKPALLKHPRQFHAVLIAL